LSLSGVFRDLHSSQLATEEPPGRPRLPLHQSDVPLLI
jgi:hypothetical protein